MSSSSTAAAPNLGSLPSEKLTRENYTLWKAQVLPAIRGARMIGLLDGTEAAPPEKLEAVDKSAPATPNPAYDNWVARDQQVLSYLVNSLSPNILLHVHNKEHAAEVWTALADMFASQARARITNLRIALGNTKKKELTTDAFFSKMKGFADELAAAGKPVDDAEMVSFIVAGLDNDYDSVVAAINALPSSIPVTVSDLYTQVVQYDQRQEMLGNTGGGGFSSSANAASRGQQQRSRGKFSYRGKSSPRGRGDRGQGDRNNNKGGRQASSGGRGRGRGRARTTPWVDTTCQICNKEGHAARDCWWRFEEDDDDYDDKEAHAASYGVDTNWYADSGASHHITGELDKMTVREQYRGKDRVHTADGSGSVHPENTA